MFEGKEFLTIQEAVEVTKKAPNTIRSLVTSNYHDSTKVVTKKKGKKFAYLINKKFLLEYFEISNNYQENITKRNQNSNDTISENYQDSSKLLPSKNIEFYEEIIRNQQQQIIGLQKLLENQQVLSLEAKKTQEIKERPKGFLRWFR